VTRLRRAAGLALVAVAALSSLHQAEGAALADQSARGSPPPARHGLQGFQPTSMSFADTSTGYLLGYARTTGYNYRLGRGALLARTDDGGRSWMRVPVPKGFRHSTTALRSSDS
jgi:hypothetical protein